MRKTAIASIPKHPNRFFIVRLPGRCVANEDAKIVTAPKIAGGTYELKLRPGLHQGRPAAVNDT